MFERDSNLAQSISISKKSESGESYSIISSTEHPLSPKLAEEKLEI